MRGAKRKRTKHYPFHRSSPSRLPRSSSSHSCASLSRQIQAAAAHPPHLRRLRHVLPISGGRGGPAGGRDFPSSGALRRRWPMPLSRSPLPGGKSRRPQLILPISGGRDSSSPSPDAALRRRRGTRGLVAGGRVQLFVAVAGAPRRQRGRRLVAGGRPIWTPRGGVSQLGWAVSSRLGRNVFVREFLAQIRRDTRTRRGYISRPYPKRIRIGYVSDTGYAPSLPYPCF